METISIKPDKFNGQNFKRWQRQTKYWLTVLGLSSALDDTIPTQPNGFINSMTNEQIDFHCHNRILSALSDHLYDIYHNTTKSANDLWKTLEAEYGIEDAGIKRFDISNFTNFKMVDGKSIGDQIHEFKELLRKAESNGTILSEDFKVSCIIDKLPSSWSDFARSLRHKQGELLMIQVISALRIEENHRSSLNAMKPYKVNLVENQSQK